MQIDFHHGVTYILARLAGFSREQAQIIAHSAQYVDDATKEGVVKFDNYSMFRCIASAHKAVDYRNFEALKNHLVWIPFHFLPGNQVSGYKGVPEFVERIICRPNSEVAQAMVAKCIRDRSHKHSIYRLGITMHVFADTWAHQGFAGISHPVNIVNNILNWRGEIDYDLNDRVDDFYNRPYWKALVNKFKSVFLKEVAPLGHGTVLSYPDRPYLKWKYEDFRGHVVERNNPETYMDAVVHLHKAMGRFLNGDHRHEPPPMKDHDLATIKEMIEGTTDDDGEIRHQKWLQAIADGKFSFGAESVVYVPTGAGSWRHRALGTEIEDLTEQLFIYSQEFLDSDWKLFHDAISNHRHVILHELLPEFGLSAA
ncbi:DUF6765 family protein [Pseudobacteriovorax antillogorgiicola]|uniref:Uncharacterized protein n=1 Tax=Pseudobacteriovorax antillogorgiicola TaxID=1513793 RepID=A0A1Y6CEP6_9BACT|nr:DUF6765 family protein [Pseudobacteriovorax antillogorgiicola]TCS49067.1 hypothetical protein EDD56_116110 [Pseudobacteriovorax antillogorgiicola]SMF52272.1 hypothetical protein SAMN06296036_11644 [Pseudobacteriovorax antillogorgiicola]